MDPFSTTASATPLLVVAGQSARLLCQLFNDFRHAPAEIERYCQMLDGLTGTFSALEALQTKDGSRPQLGDDFAERLAACVADLQAVHARIQQSNPTQPKGALQKSWRRLKWSTTSDAWLEKFLGRLHIYHADFALAIACTQL